MTAQGNTQRGSTVCVDIDTETVAGEAADTDGAPFYHAEETCNEIQYPPYEPQKELTCAVCTKYRICRY